MKKLIARSILGSSIIALFAIAYKIDGVTMCVFFAGAVILSLVISWAVENCK